MKDILITTDADGGTAVLTVDAPGSHYGIPVLRIEAADIGGDFGPADILSGPPLLYAAQVVAGWAAEPIRTAADRSVARSFCAQWPDGPQVPT